MTDHPTLRVAVGPAAHAWEAPSPGPSSRRAPRWSRRRRRPRWSGCRVRRRTGSTRCFTTASVGPAPVRRCRPLGLTRAPRREPPVDRGARDLRRQRRRAHPRSRVEPAGLLPTYARAASRDPGAKDRGRLLRDATVVVVGEGGSGQEFIRYLAPMGPNAVVLTRRGRTVDDAHEHLAADHSSRCCREPTSSCWRPPPPRGPDSLSAQASSSCCRTTRCW
jgi:hypothetical protein